MSSVMSNMPINSFDVVFGVLVVLLAWRGFSRGAISQLAAVLSIIVGWVVAMRGSDKISPMILLDEPMRHYVAMAVLFVVALIAVLVAGWFAQTIFRTIFLGWLDRLAGAALGAVKAVLIGVIVTLVAVLGSDATAHWVGGSASGTFCVAVILKTERIIPDDVGARFNEQLAEFQSKITKLEAAGELTTLPTLMKESPITEHIAAQVAAPITTWWQEAVTVLPELTPAQTPVQQSVVRVFRADTQQAPTQPTPQPTAFDPAAWARALLE